jgi:hypothetical protein
MKYGKSPNYRKKEEPFKLLLVLLGYGSRGAARAMLAALVREA